MIQTTLEQLPRAEETGRERRQMVVLLSKDVDPWAVRAFTEFFGALKGKVPAVEQVTITKGNWRIGWKIPVTLPVNETEQQSIGGSDNAEI